MLINIVFENQTKQKFLLIFKKIFEFDKFYLSLYMFLDLNTKKALGQKFIRNCYKEVKTKVDTFISDIKLNNFVYKINYLLKSLFLLHKISMRNFFLSIA